MDYSLVTRRQRELWPAATESLVMKEHTSVVSEMLAWSRKTPGQTAIRMDDKSYSYQQFADAVLGIAGSVRSAGVREGQRVIIDMDRSYAYMASLYGVLAVGAVIVPFDSELPSERKKLMYRQVKADAVIKPSSVASLSWLDAQDSVIEITVEKAGAVVDPPSKPLTFEEVFVPDQKSPAYVFFTSGTTGEPKGILGRYAGLNHFIQWQRDRFKIMQGDRVSQLTALSFDVCLRDIFLPLTCGATLCIPPTSVCPISAEAFNWLESEEITTIHTVPSILNTWLQTILPGRTLPKLRYTFSAGEPLRSDLVVHWKKTATNTKIINLYGPTETTLAKCFYEVPEEVPVGVQPVGYALPDADVSIMNQNKAEAGIGEIGEIVIHTPYASLGYLDSVQDNRSAFLPHPWKQNTSDLLYRTGDLGRLHPEGFIEILGRVDDQIKIRGVRIEPKSIERLLEDHPQVKNCRVIGVENEESEKQLAAYLVHEGTLSHAALHNYLTELLPPSMIPSAFVFLDKIPLTINGKLDTKALPKPEFKRSKENVPFIEATSELEIKFADIFKRLLNVDKVSIHDNFFHLGGNSLLVARLCYFVKEETGEHLQVASVFKCPTVALLAKLFSEESCIQDYSLLIGEEGSGDPVFLAPGIARNALMLKEVADHLSEDHPCYALELPVPENGEEPNKTFEELADHCVNIMRRIQPKGPYNIAGFSFGGILAFAIAQRLYEQDGLTHRVFMVDSKHRYKGDKTPLESSRLKWLLSMAAEYKFEFLGYWFKHLVNYHVLRRFGLKRKFVPRRPELRRMKEGIPLLKSADYHFQYNPTPFPVDLTVFTVRYFLFTRRGHAEITRWDTHITTQANYVLLDAEHHMQILDEENPKRISDLMKEGISKDDTSED